MRESALGGYEARLRQGLKRRKDGPRRCVSSAVSARSLARAGLRRKGVACATQEVFFSALVVFFSFRDLTRERAVASSR